MHNCKNQIILYDFFLNIEKALLSDVNCKHNLLVLLSGGGVLALLSRTLGDVVSTGHTDVCPDVLLARVFVSSEVSSSKSEQGFLGSLNKDALRGKRRHYMNRIY